MGGGRGEKTGGREPERALLGIATKGEETRSTGPSEKKKTKRKRKASAATGWLISTSTAMNRQREPMSRIALRRSSIYPAYYVLS
jgi:hypothetical protein